MDDKTEDYGYASVPEGLTDLLHDFAVAVLTNKPKDLYEFAADYFVKRKEEKKSKTVPLYIIVEGEEAGEPEQLRRLTDTKQSNRRKSVSAERYNPEEDASDGDADALPQHPKTDQQRALLKQAIQNILLFRTLDDEQLKNVIDAMVYKEVNAEEVIIKQGDDGDFFYVIGRGVYDVYSIDDRGISQLLNCYDNEGSFGELALMYSQPRMATVIARESGFLWAMDRHSFQKVVTKGALKNRKRYESLLNQVPFLQPLNELERNRVVDALCTKVFYSGSCIVKTGDAGDGMFFIEEGACSVKITNGDKEEDVTELRVGQYFGELALLENSSRTASVYAIGRVKCAFLERESFERLLGPCRDIMKRDTASYKHTIYSH